MGKNLYVASSIVEYEGIAISTTATEAIHSIFDMFGIETTAENSFASTFEVERSQLILLRDMIKCRTETFRMHATEFQRELDRADMSCSEFVEALDKMIDRSDQKCDTVQLSWF